jgi:hypothetical protein
MALGGQCVGETLAADLFLVGPTLFWRPSAGVLAWALPWAAPGGRFRP